MLTPHVNLMTLKNLKYIVAVTKKPALQNLHVYYVNLKYCEEMFCQYYVTCTELTV